MLDAPSRYGLLLTSVRLAFLPNLQPLHTEYLHNDSLHMRVKQVVVYSTPLPLKTPSWQNPRNVSQSVCKFTMSNFSKRKQFNGRFYGPPFFTHSQGYKMCVEVYSNGEHSGKDTHVSVYVRLMAGNNVCWGNRYYAVELARGQGTPQDDYLDQCKQ